MNDQQAYCTLTAFSGLQLREHFAQANASLALDDLIVDAEALAVQERVIHGKLSFDHAAELYLAIAQKSKSPASLR